MLNMFETHAHSMTVQTQSVLIFMPLKELEQVRSRIARDEVNVEVDPASGPELGTILSELRSQYEGIVKKNKEQAEQWYRKKVWDNSKHSSVYTHNISI